MPLKPKHPAARHLGPPLVRCREYLAFVRRQKCLGCDGPAAEAHHWGPHGLGKKAPDWWAVPLCRDCHVATHENATFRFQLMRQVDVAQRDLLVAWLLEQEASQPDVF